MVFFSSIKAENSYKKAIASANNGKLKEALNHIDYSIENQSDDRILNIYWAVHHLLESIINLENNLIEEAKKSYFTFNEYINFTDNFYANDGIGTATRFSFYKNEIINIIRNNRQSFEKIEEFKG